MPHCMARTCTHLGAIREVTPSGDGCTECLQIGNTWVHLRLSLTYGRVGYYDARRHEGGRRWLR